MSSGLNFFFIFSTSRSLSVHKIKPPALLEVFDYKKATISFHVFELSIKDMRKLTFDFNNYIYNPNLFSIFKKGLSHEN